MLLTAQKLEGYSLHATDGEIGKVKDMYFDDRQWRVRYVVVDTGDWLSGRKVLISPYAMGVPEIENETIPVTLSKEEIESSPSIDSNKPITKEYEEALHTFHDWPHYWTGANYYGGIYGGLGAAAAPFDPAAGAVAAEGALPDSPPSAEEQVANLSEAERHLQSIKEVRNWPIEASDGGLGHVEDLMVSPMINWSIRHMVVDTRNWLPGRKVLVAPHWISRVDWMDKKVYIVLDQDTIKGGPEFDSSKAVDKDYELELQSHYQSAVSLH